MFDASTGQWTTIGSLAAGRFDAAAALLTNGQAIVAGGRTGALSPGPAFTFLSSAELFTPGVATACRVCAHDGTCVTLDKGTPCTSGVCDGAGACR